MLHVRNRNRSASRLRRGRAHIAPSPEPAQAPAEHAERPLLKVELHDERRMRESGGPDDRAVYGCGCGYVFRADVSTSVACPHCGSAQAW